MDQDLSDSPRTDTVDFGRPGGSTRPFTHPGRAAVGPGLIWDKISLSSLDLSPQRQELTKPLPQSDLSSSGMSSLDGQSVTEPGPASAEARRVDTSTLRWTHRMQDGEELDGSLSEESEKESSPCRIGRERMSSSPEADDPVTETDTWIGAQALRVRLLGLKS